MLTTSLLEFFCSLKEMTAIRIFCLCHLSLLCMSLGFTHISADSLSEYPGPQPSLHLPTPSLNGLSICFSLDVGFPDKLHVIILSIDGLLMNLALSIYANLIPLLPVPLESTPRQFHSLVIQSNLNISAVAFYTNGAHSSKQFITETLFIH